MSKGRTPPREWGEWFECEIDAEHYTSHGIEPPHRIVRNNLYTVNMTRMVPATDEYPTVIHLSIKRNDRKVLRDWRHLQRIKNELVGPEYEGMEIFPAEERLVDSANQYHVWVIDDPSFRWPWGFNVRFVGGPEEAEAIGAVQRPFED